MNAKISKDFTFNAGIFFENSFLINIYDIKLSLLVLTEDAREQNIALERITYLIHGCFENSVFVKESETKVIDLYCKAGLAVCVLPDDPYDQVVAATLMTKFNIITENRLLVTDIQIQSLICNNVVFYLSNEDQIDFLVYENTWYTENNANINNLNKKSKKEKVVELKKEYDDWHHIGLTWKNKTNLRDQGEIVFIPADK